MRATLPLIAAAALPLLAGCNDAREVSAAPPSVSYQVTGNDVSSANSRASSYCQQYGMAAQLQGVQPNGTGGLASYICTGAGVGSVGTGPAYGGTASAPYYSSPQPYYGSSAPPIDGTLGPAVQCADVLHQDRPGGSDYHGPPVPGCTP